MRQVLVAVTLAVFAASGQTGFAQTDVPKNKRELESPKKATRLQAISTLGSLGKGARSAAPELQALVERESDSYVALQAVQALTRIGAHRQLQALLQNPGLHIQMHAVMGLGVIGPAAKKTVPDLLRLLEDEQPILRCLAVQALAEIGLESETETRAVIKLLADPQLGVRPYASLALMNLGAASVPALEKVLADSEPIEVRVASLQALASQGPQAKLVVPTLIKLLTDPEPVVRAQSAATLAAIGGDAKDAMPALFDGLLDQDLQVQTFAFQAVMVIGQEDRRALSASLKSANAKGRWAAQEAFAGKNAVPGLIKNLSDKDNGTRIASALALGRIGKDAEPAIPPLTRMVKDDNKQVQNAARQALAQLDQKNAEVYFKKLRLEQEQWMRDAKIQQAKFAAGMAKIVPKAQMELLKINNPQAWLQVQRAHGGAQNLSAAVRNRPQQVYLRQLMMMHIAYSSMKEPPPDADWVRDQISDTGVEAVPALVEAFNLGINYDLGFV